MTRVLLAVALLLLTACVPGAPDAGTGAGDGDARSAQLPDVTLAGFEGGEGIDLAALRGPAVINLWASWCGPCRKEMPLLQQFHQRYGDRVRMVGIDFQDTQSAKAADLVEETGVTYDLVVDEQGVINGQGAFPVIRGLPFLAFVDESGEVVHVEATVVESVDELVDDVDQHLGVAL
jgi:cytochrome c biogenesis protein CcmG, thiol:disulfide interchange protein DsbE